MADRVLPPEDKRMVLGHRQRMKDEFVAGGFQGWTDEHRLELLLFYSIPQKDVRVLAKTLVRQFGGFSGVLDAPYQSLLAVEGVGPNTASYLKLFTEVGAAYVRDRGKSVQQVTTAQEASLLLLPHFFGQKNEQVHILCLDGKKQPLGTRLVAEGSILATDINLRRIAEEALALRATSLYIAHNHVTCDPNPSQGDWEATEQMIHALFQIGLYLEDHLVISDDRMVSLREIAPSCHRTLSW